ncbi:MAG: ZIP family metal transporter [Candidatus Komeilibacteria bacterium CG_4_10_14_0_2_um_filter_37_10]|uniref:ZIP family metal transporter n=1 Tax=Candidatus Komeilibacteria bacterium CG_4_10_14_0_2_um_filter_37_10 TaxID=1974470 RepID=A0A2M7VGB9_9BACT|nr:MAG: ZIP family metal transporter [Candidatus Komeilibacteria bacterium CG_4_10_14_0_2_um_filter_37_10]PJA94353.1 MAG: ZIP family metal transporter [Candidatus Komeilibacteria bacterium CG_4_9_14_3_um_filter_37_5]
MIIIHILLSITAISLVSLVGVFFLFWQKNVLDKVIAWLVSLSVGALLGDTFFHLLPEAVAKNNGLITWLLVVFGIIIFLILEKIIHWRHCHISTSSDHPHPVGLMNTLGDLFHNFFDGMIVAGSYLVSPELGLMTTLAVLAHEVPQEIGDFGILLFAGYSRSKALLINFLTASSAFLGALLIYFLGPNIYNFTDYIVPLTAGGFIYIAVADLLPELQKESRTAHSFYQIFGILIGLALMLFLKYLVA